MSYQRFFKDVQQVCGSFFAEKADKTTERAVNKALGIVLNYYKLVQSSLFKDETITAKLTITDDNITNIQLVLSEKLEQEYNKGR